MNLQRISVLVGIMVLAGCDSNDPFRPRLLADLTNDVTPPTLTGFDFSPKLINTSDAGGSVTVTFTIADDASGANYIFVVFRAPSGIVYRASSTSFGPAVSQSGSFEVDFPQYSETGSWKVEFVQLHDAAGNESNFYTADLSAKGFSTTLAVFSAVEDVTPPILNNFDIEPKTVVTSNGPASARVFFTLLDDVSGITSISVYFYNPSGTGYQSASSTFGPASGYASSLDVTFSQNSEVGTWPVGLIKLVDAVGNERNIFASDLSAMGFPSALTVVNTLGVSVDIQPGSSLNSIKLIKKGKVTVGILSDTDFDAPSTVVRSSLTFGHTGDEQSLASCAKEGEDVNRDGFKDLVCQFYVQRTGFQVGDAQGILRGRTVDQVPIEGKDAVRILK